MLITHIQFFASFVIAVAATMAVVPPLRRTALRRRWLDLPDEVRKVHTQPVPSVGGLAIVTGSMVGLIYLVSISPLLPFELVLPPSMIWIGAALMVCTGIFDDLRGLGFREKFVMQIMAGYLIMLAGYRINVGDIPFLGGLDPFTEAMISVPLSLLWIVGLINAVNLLDGLDGLAAGLGVIALSSLAFIHGIRGDAGSLLLALPLMGGLIGFLVYNFNPASIFMGDSGSLFIGYMLAVYSLQGSVHTEPLPALLILIVVLGLPVVDTCSSMARRYFRGTGLFSPDRDHVHHRLSARFSHRISVLILYGVGMALGMVGVFMAVSAAAATYWIFGLVLAIALLGLRYLAHFSAETQATDSGEAALRSRALKKGLRESEAQAATSTRYSSGSELPTSATLAGQS